MTLFISILYLNHWKHDSIIIGSQGRRVEIDSPGEYFQILCLDNYVLTSQDVSHFPIIDCLLLLVAIFTVTPISKLSG